MTLRQFHGEIDCSDHAVRSRDSFAGNFERSPVIRAGPRKWEAQRDVHTFVKRMQLEWD